MSDQREKILACACELYLEDGLEGFSMRKLAKAVGVTAPALYRHYEGKEGVLMDVVGEAYERLAQYLYRALQGRDAAERFSMAGEAYMTFGLEQPRLYEVLFASPDLMGMEGLPDEVEARACAVGNFWNDRVRECMESDILREGDPEEVGMTLWAHAHGLLSLYLRGMLQIDEETFRHLYKGSAHRMFRGLATEAFSGTLKARVAETERDGTGMGSLETASAGAAGE